LPIIIRRNPDKPKVKSLLERFKLEIEPEEYNLKPIANRVAIFDSETDPFAKERNVKPFMCGFYMTDTKEYVDFIGEDCIEQFMKWLSQFPEGTFTIFAHNGGNFDFYFLIHYFDKGHKPFIISGRLVRVMIQGQEFRDSYAMIPVALGEYQKTEIDYRMFERGFRDVFMPTIRSYQRDDCIFLADLVVNWLDMFGNKLTMASVALPMLRSYHGFECLSPTTDQKMRPYYFGGRNQCFSTGILHGDFKIYDINSSYPNVMKRFRHPISDTPIWEKTINEKTHFAHIRAWSAGALPIRGNGGDLAFPIGVNDFYACIHEIRAGLETGTLSIRKVYSSCYFREETCFDEFIDEFYKLRLEAKGRGDKIRTLFYKLVMNSSYGKFAQDPRRYENWLFDPDKIPEPRFCEPCNKKAQLELAFECDGEAKGTNCSPYGWNLHTTNQGVNIYASPQQLRANSFFNVATAASITSAARAQLLRGIQSANRPVYCDTDSIICEGWKLNSIDNGIRIDPHELGAWDVEATGDTLAIAGKKLYALFNNGEPIKKASKGVRLTASEIERVARGEVIEYANPVPKWNLGMDLDSPSDADLRKMFTTRKIRATG
jgi:hypothetical protein